MSLMQQKPILKLRKIQAYNNNKRGIIPRMRCYETTNRRFASYGIDNFIFHCRPFYSLRYLLGEKKAFCAFKKQPNNRGCFGIFNGNILFNSRNWILLNITKRHGALITIRGINER